MEALVMIRLLIDEEHSNYLAFTIVTRMNMLTRNGGACFCSDMNTMRHGLYSLYCGTQSQWRSCSMFKCAQTFGNANDCHHSVHDKLQTIQTNKKSNKIQLQ